MLGETLKSATASIQKGVARADGKLYFTGDKLIFEPFNQQFGLGPYAISCDEIVSVEPCQGRGGGLIPVTRDAMRITLSDAMTYEFILQDPTGWIDLLHAKVA